MTQPKTHKHFALTALCASLIWSVGIANNTAALCKAQPLPDSDVCPPANFKNISNLANTINARYNSKCGFFLRGLELKTTTIPATSTDSPPYGDINDTQSCLASATCKSFYNTLIQQELGDYSAHDTAESSNQAGSGAATWLNHELNFPLLYGYADPNMPGGLYTPNNQTPGIFLLFDGTQDVCCQYGMDAGVNGCPQINTTPTCSADVQTAASDIQKGAKNCTFNQPNNSQSSFAQTYNLAVTDLLTQTTNRALENQTELKWAGTDGIRAILYMASATPENTSGMLCIAIKAIHALKASTPICQAAYGTADSNQHNSLSVSSCMTMESYYSSHCQPKSKNNN